MSNSRGQARTGEIKRTAGGWAIRYRDGQGVRRQKGGFRTKAEAKTVLDEELRKARLGPLYRPDVTLKELVDAFLDQYQGAPSSKDRLDQYLGKATAKFGDRPVSEINVLDLSRWRASLPETMRHGAVRSLRQALGAAHKWQWIERNVALDVPNPMHARQEFVPFDTWEEVEAVAHELGPFGPLMIFSIGTGVRPEEAFGAEWVDVDLEAGVFTVRRSFAKGRLKPYAKTARSRRRIPLRAKVIDALESLHPREGILFPASGGGRINIDNWRRREWTPALIAAGIEHRRIYDMRHTFATWSLAAGMSIFTLARRMGTSVQMIDQTYGHLARDAEDQDRGLLDRYDGAENARGHVVGTIADATKIDADPENDEGPANARPSVQRAREDSNL
ncbi:tyrosine-type recombinase/integrase [Solirubrobacter sp. CPCC 204708]|uniref:Site-specific integrase n=1 Tax=Solirubrobacter deserti TaxID=2282478 RepID=A0ABT4RFA8_9ACTN|nr:site-specific integrase [Solirubrobacter deserti]MBE2318588.1 tyrosine-type recombinase/integrase [Solirubrobacter deserti]MDA0137046.1 site-specific integrase [Solirubrobacter deserti]